MRETVKLYHGDGKWDPGTRRDSWRDRMDGMGEEKNGVHDKRTDLIV